MTITRRLLIGALATPALLGRANAQAIRLRFAHPHPDSDSWNRASRIFAQMVNDRSQGTLNVQVFGNGVLGSDPTTIAAARGGSLDIVLTGNPYFTGLAPKLNVLDLPFLFKDRRHVTAVLDGPIGQELRGDLDGSNLHVLGFWDIGFRNLTNSRRAISAPADLRGLKIRTTPNPAHIKAFQLLGANPVPMPFTELFTALETRTVDGQENPTTLILNARFYEVQRHVSITRHAYTAGILAVGKQRWDSLTPAQRDILQSVANEVTPQQRAMNEDAEASSLAELKAKGMEAVEHPDREAFARVVTEEVRRDFASRYGTALPDAIDAAGA
ncbi:tripartite ATP-independent transporter DctP family solute receptor [Humitalea rosea]|uniref:Tripartite ATP-independent transporter DctP family solute receptor n=1 Tax=Humitalea rosea TaxID=990373 RepID=A0A2W7J1S8_9PROT|nr:TRAP transporter substrate-binding protein [Humitalea rosea]PZW44923.1 tripartite ATP-independent transporter DctP family solute receptor [Humitalea rosea]